MMVAQVTGLEPGDFVHTLGDAHIYNNHIEQVKLQLTRQPYRLPSLVLNPDIKDLFSFRYEDLTLVDYVAHPNIKGDISV
jgi:thymidylate synthase